MAQSILVYVPLPPKCSLQASTVSAGRTEQAQMNKAEPKRVLQRMLQPIPLLRY